MRVLPRRGLLGEALTLSRETGPPLSEGGMRAACAARARMRASLAASLAAAALAACGDGVERGPDPLTVRANSGGSVEVASASGAPVTVAAGGSAPAAAGEALTLTARPAAFHRFASWVLSGSASCRSGEGANPCVLAAGSSSPGDSVAAAFEPRAFSVSWQGPGSVAADVGRAALVADPYAPGAFAGWRGAPCDGSAALECDLSAASGDDPLPAAAFRPFVADVGSIVFGLGYQTAAQAEPPLGFQVLFDEGGGAGFIRVLNDIAPAGDSARLAVPDTLAHPWGAGRYRTEACDGRGTCVPLPDGEAALERLESAAAAAYFKAPVAGGGDAFGYAIALSADGTTLVVGASGEDSAATGAFAPTDDGYQAALDSDGGYYYKGGAVYVYRRSEAGR